MKQKKWILIPKTRSKTRIAEIQAKVAEEQGLKVYRPTNCSKYKPYPKSDVCSNCKGLGIYHSN